MNHIIRNMITRRSIRNFKPDMPEKKDIDEIIEAGLYAPSGMNRQSTAIIAVTDKKMRDRIARDNSAIMGSDRDPFYNAPVILIVLADRSCPTYVYDGSLVMGNMLNAANSLGLGSIWVHRAKEEFNMPFYKELLADLGISGDYEGIGHCCIGYAENKPEAPERKDGRVFRIE